VTLLTGSFTSAQKVIEAELQFREALHKHQVESDFNGAISSNRTSLLRPATARCVHWISRLSDYGVCLFSWQAAAVRLCDEDGRHRLSRTGFDRKWQARTGGGLESSGEVSVANGEIVDLLRKGGQFAYIMRRALNLMRRALNLAYAIRVLAILSASAATR